MTQVKICGIRSVEHALHAAACGASMIGLNFFALSKRRISPAEAQPIVDALHVHAPHVMVVGLFVNAELAEIAAIVRTVGLHAVQLSGTELYTDLTLLHAHLAEALPQGTPVFPVLKSVRLNGDATEAAWLASAPNEVLLLVDAHAPGSYGGTGTLADWQSAAQLARTRPIMLAGGLTPANVAEAIGAVQPWGVDVSSGVETTGTKDATKIRDFLAAANVV